MKVAYTVEILHYTPIDTLPNAWNSDQYKALLEALEYGDTSTLQPSELKDMTLLALSDLEPNEAAKILLDFIFNDQLNEGQKDNLSYEMQEEKMWEEYAEIALHEEFFNIGQLVYQAYNGKFPRPEAVHFQLKISAKKEEALAVFKNDPETHILRLLSQGMPKNTLLNRLYVEELQKDDFEEAPHILWQLDTVATDENSKTFDIHSSGYWFHDLKYMNPFEASLALE